MPRIFKVDSKDFDRKASTGKSFIPVTPFDHRLDRKGYQLPVYLAVIKKVSSESSLGYEEELDFDALVLCNGRPYSSPIRPSTGLDQSSQTAAATISQRISEIELCSSTLQLACEIGHGQGVVVIGGGLVGVEFMGEIVHRIVSKKPKSSISPCRLVLISRGK